MSSTDESSFFHNKKCPPDLMAGFRKALSFFPELQNTFIFIHEMSFYGVQHTVRSYPPYVILHWPKSKWVYPIILNKTRGISINFHDLSFDEQVGLLAHELAHISDFIKFSRYDIMKFTFKYAFNKNFVKNLEEKTDTKTIAKGAGIYLMKWRLYAFKARLEKPYREMADTYMTPDQILIKMKTFPNFYPEKVISNFRADINNLNINKKIHEISFSRNIKHSIKTIFDFLIQFVKMFYLIPIKRFHLK